MGWGGYGGYGFSGDLGYGQGEMSMIQEDYSPAPQGTENSVGYYGGAPPVEPSDANAAGAAAPGQGSATPLPPAQLVFKDGSAYAVKGYWISNGDLYYQPVYGGLNHVSLDRLDLSATVDANTKAGVPFTLSTQAPPR